MKTLPLVLIAALLLGGCAGAEKAAPAAVAATSEPAVAAPQDEAARKLAEQQAASEARVAAAREIAMAQQAQREAAMAEAEARAAAERERQASEAAQAERLAAEEQARRVLEESAKRQGEAKLAAERAAKEAEAAAAAAKAAAEKAAADAAKEKTVTPADSGDLNVVAVVETTAGTMVVGFYPDIAPGHVKNFVDLSRKGFYDGTRFHRTIPGFMIQGGDPFTKDMAQQSRWGTGDPGYKIKAEFSARPHERGTLSMARSQSPDSAGSQFFVCHARAASLDRQYTVFGELLSGYDVLDKIATAPAGPQPGSGERSRPLDPVQVVKVTIRPRTADDVKKGG